MGGWVVGGGECQVKDAKHRAIVAKYCAKDCELVYRLVRRLDILPQYIEMSKVTGVTLNDLNTRGQQIKARDPPPPSRVPLSRAALVSLVLGEGRGCAQTRDRRVWAPRPPSPPPCPSRHRRAHFARAHAASASARAPAQ